MEKVDERITGYKTVPHDEVVLINGEECKEIPGFSKRYASVTGKLYRKVNEIWEQINTHELKTSVGSYIYAAFKNDEGIQRSHGVHRFVCLAWKPQPIYENGKTVVNHIDSDRHNNALSNLEWTCQSDNCYHAIASGARVDNVDVTMTNILTGQTQTWLSVKHCAKELGITRRVVNLLIHSTHTKPLYGQWIFRINTERLGIVRRKIATPVCAFDHVEKKIYVANSMAELAYSLGMEFAKIQYLKGTGTMIAGYSFYNHPYFGEYSKYDSEKALTSRMEYFDDLYARAVAEQESFKVIDRTTC